jgi:hypothetical protein
MADRGDKVALLRQFPGHSLRLIDSLLQNSGARHGSAAAAILSCQLFSIACTALSGMGT